MYVILDLETTSEVRYSRVASPFYNHILAVGLKYQGEEKPRTYYQDHMPKDWLKDVNMIVAHNAKFDLMYLWHLQELQEYFKNGGKVWCTQLAEFMLSGQKHKYPALRDIAVNMYGCPERTKHIEKYKLGKFIGMLAVPKEEVLIDVGNDCLDTEQVVKGQVTRAKKLNMYNLIKAEMDALLATTEMEINGFKVDLAVLQRNRAELQAKRDNSNKELMKSVEKYWRI